MLSTDGLNDLFRAVDTWDITSAEGKVYKRADILRELMRNVKQKKGKEYLYIWDGVFRTELITYEEFSASLKKA